MDLLGLAINREKAIFYESSYKPPGNFIANLKISLPFSVRRSYVSDVSVAPGVSTMDLIKICTHITN
jgi:hypothetical protein